MIKFIKRWFSGSEDLKSVREWQFTEPPVQDTDSDLDSPTLWESQRDVDQAVGADQGSGETPGPALTTPALDDYADMLHWMERLGIALMQELQSVKATSGDHADQIRSACLSMLPALRAMEVASRHIDDVVSSSSFHQWAGSTLTQGRTVQVTEAATFMLSALLRFGNNTNIPASEAYDQWVVDWIHHSLKSHWAGQPPVPANSVSNVVSRLFKSP